MKLNFIKCRLPVFTIKSVIHQYPGVLCKTEIKGGLINSEYNDSIIVPMSPGTSDTIIVTKFTII